jgi:hypothetical protein
LCPVGALTSSSYSFRSRPWDLKTFESIDLSDGFGSTVYICTKEIEIVRVFSKLNYVSKNVFISDRARYYFDYQTNNRLLTVSFLEKKDKNNTKTLKNLFWNSMYEAFDSKFRKKSINILLLVDGCLDFENLVHLKNLKNFLISKKTQTYNLKFLGINILKSNFYVNWLNSQLINIDLTSKFCILISSNLKIENILINTRLRIKLLQNNLSIYGFSFFKENYNINFFNLKIYKMYAFFESKILLSLFFLKNKYPLFIIGENFFKRGFLFNNLYLILKKINITAIFIRSYINSNIEGLSFLNIKPLRTRDLKKDIMNNFVFGIDLSDSFFLKKNLIKSIYININTHKSNIKSFFSIPCKTQYEEEKIFINLEQKIQKTTKIIFSKNNIFSIKNIIFSILNIPIDCIKLSYLKYFNFFKELLKKSEIFLSLNTSLIFSLYTLNSFANTQFLISKYPIKNLLEDNYLLNKILQNSKNMQINSQFFRKKTSNF